MTLRAQPCPGRVPFIVGGVRSSRSGPQETVEPTVCAPRRLDETTDYERPQKDKRLRFR